MDATARMHLATRIHYALLRYLGTGIEANRMLADASYAREVLYVCEGSRDETLQDLARQFAAASAPRQAKRQSPSRETPAWPAPGPQASAQQERERTGRAGAGARSGAAARSGASATPAASATSGASTISTSSGTSTASRRPGPQGASGSSSSSSGAPVSRPAPQDATWAGNTSGFGFAVPSDFEDERLPRRSPGRFSLARWLRRDGRP
jgi:hypothetical protein